MLHFIQNFATFGDSRLKKGGDTRPPSPVPFWSAYEILNYKILGNHYHTPLLTIHNSSTYSSESIQFYTISHRRKPTARVDWSCVYPTYQTSNCQSTARVSDDDHIGTLQHPYIYALHSDWLIYLDELKIEMSACILYIKRTNHFPIFHHTHPG